MGKWLLNWLIRRLVTKERIKQKANGYDQAHDRGKGKVHLYHQAWIYAETRDDPIAGLALLRAVSEMGDAWHVTNDSKRRDRRR